jgi:hypothetical protein
MYRQSVGDRRRLKPKFRQPAKFQQSSGAMPRSTFDKPRRPFRKRQRIIV